MRYFCVQKKSFTKLLQETFTYIAEFLLFIFFLRRMSKIIANFLSLTANRVLIKFFFKRMPPQQNYPPCTVFYPDKGLELDRKNCL